MPHCFTLQSGSVRSNLILLSLYEKCAMFLVGKGIHRNCLCNTDYNNHVLVRGDLFLTLMNLSDVCC